MFQVVKDSVRFAGVKLWLGKNFVAFQVPFVLKKRRFNFASISLDLPIKNFDSKPLSN